MKFFYIFKAVTRLLQHLNIFFVILWQKDMRISTEIRTLGVVDSSLLSCCCSFDDLRLPWAFWIATTASWLWKDTHTHRYMYMHVGSSVNAKVFLKLGRIPVQPGLAVNVEISCSVFCVKFTSEICFLEGKNNMGNYGGFWSTQVTLKQVLLLFH